MMANECRHMLMPLSSHFNSILPSHQNSNPFMSTTIFWLLENLLLIFPLKSYFRRDRRVINLIVLQPSFFLLLFVVHSFAFLKHKQDKRIKERKRQENVVKNAVNLHLKIFLFNFIFFKFFSWLVFTWA